MAINIMISVSGYLRPSEDFKRINVLPPVAGVSEFWSLLLHPEEGLQRSKTGFHDDSILLDSPYLVGWIGLVLKVLTEGHPHGLFFEPKYSDFLEQIRISWQRPGAGRCGAVPKETLRVSFDLNSKFRSLQEGQKGGRWRQHPSMSRYEKRPRLQATPSRYSPRRASLHFSELHTTTS